MNECAVGQVMNIQSAELGYSVEYNPTTNPPYCPGNNCTAQTDEPARRCNGRHACRISQEILIYPPGSALCTLSRDGNFIRVRFTCVTGTVFFNVLMQRASIACYAELCISYSKSARPSVYKYVRLSHAGVVSK